MQFEITVKSSPEARYDGSVDDAVRDALTSVGLGVTYDEGGSMFGPGVDRDSAAENHFGIEVPDEAAARNAALVVAFRMKRPVSFYRYGDDVDVASAPHMIVTPGDMLV